MRLRPQIFLALLILGSLSGFGVWQGYNEIATGCIGGLTAIAMKILENE